jgi:hypothetical protein
MIDYYMGELIEPETITTIDIGVWLWEIKTRNKLF